MSLSFNCTEKHLEIGVFPELLRWIKVSMIPSYCYVQGLWGGECFSFAADANEDIWLLKYWSGEQVPLLSGKNEKSSGFFLAIWHTPHNKSQRWRQKSMILLFMKTVPFRMDHFPFYVIHIWHLFIIMRCVLTTYVRTVHFCLQFHSMFTAVWCTVCVFHFECPEAVESPTFW